MHRLPRIADFTPHKAQHTLVALALLASLVCASGCCSLFPRGQRSNSPWTPDGYPRFVPGTNIPYGEMNGIAALPPAIDYSQIVPSAPLEPPPRSSAEVSPQPAQPQQPPGVPNAIPSDELDSPKVVPQRLDVRSDLDLSVEYEPRAAVGSGATFRITIVNTGRKTLPNVAVDSQFDAALVFPGSDEKRARQNLGTFAPGQRREIALTLVAKTAGTHCCRFTLYSDGVETVMKEVCVEFTQKQFEVSLTGPWRRSLQSRAEYFLRLANATTRTLPAVTVHVAYPQELAIREASAGSVRAPGSLTWTLNDLKPDEGVLIELEFECVKPADAACVRIDIAADGLTPARESACVMIESPRTGWDLRVGDGDDPIDVGQETDLQVSLSNRQAGTTSRVGLTVEVPDTLSISGADVFLGNRPLTVRVSRNDQHLTFEPVELSAGGAAVNFRIRVKGKKAGIAAFRAVAADAAGRNSLERDEAIIVNPR